MSPSKKVLQSCENVPRKARSHHDSSIHKIKYNASRHHPIPLNPKHHYRHHHHRPHSHHYQYYHHAPHQYYQHHPHHQPYHLPNPRRPKAPQIEDEKQLSPPLTSSSKPSSTSSQPEQERPKAPRSAFMCFMESKKKETMEKNGIKEDNDNLLKLFAKEWKKLSPNERAHWDEEARNDKVRFVRENAGIKGPVKQIKKRAKKHPDAPKRPMSAFLMFSKESRKEVKENNPHVSNTDVSRLLGEMWRNFPKDKKARFEDKEKIERQKYKEKMRKWREEKAQEENAARHSREEVSPTFHQNQHEQQELSRHSHRYTAAFYPQQDFVPNFDRLSVDHVVEEESSSKRSAFRPRAPNHYHRSQHAGNEYFLSESHNQHSWPDLSLQPSIDHDSDPLPIVPTMPPPLPGVKVEDFSGGHQSHQNYYFQDHHFPRCP